MRKFLVFLLVFLLVLLVVLGAVAWLGSGILLEKGARKALDYLAAKEIIPGVKLDQPRFQSVKFSPFNTITLKDVSIDINVKQEADFASDRNLSLDADEIMLRMENFEDRAFLLNIKGMETTRQKASDTSLDISQKHLDRFKGDELKMQFRLNFLNQAEAPLQIRTLFCNLARFLIDGKAAMPIYFSGISTFSIGDEIVNARLWVNQEGTTSLLVMNKEDLKAISEGLKEELTEAEIELLSQHPFRAPRLLRIRDYAKAASEGEYKKNPAVPENAYRHVLWSYLLTKSYDATFAKEVTDAHETGTISSTEVDRQMDLKNNVIGRRYAGAGYAESSILGRVMDDPNVIRSVEDIIPKE